MMQLTSSREHSHDRRRANARRFLVNTLLALSAPQSIHAFRQNSLWICSGYGAVFVSSAKPGSGHPGLLARHNYSARTFATSPILLLKAAATAIHSLSPSLLLFPAHRSQHSSHALSNARGRLRPTVE